MTSTELSTFAYHRANSYNRSATLHTCGLSEIQYQANESAKIYCITQTHHIHARTWVKQTYGDIELISEQGL